MEGRDEIRLADAVAIVTGAGQGVGAAVAHMLAAAGARVAVNDINPDRAERVAQQIASDGGTALGIQADVSNKFHCVKLIEETRAAWGRLDVVVNNAHVIPTTTVIKMDEWDWMRCLDVNLKGVFFMSQLGGRVMQDSKQGGVIINLASRVGVELPLAQRAAFCASQAGVVGFTRECAREYEAYGIRVHTLLIDRFDAGTRSANQGTKIATIVRSLCVDADAATGGTIVTVANAARDDQPA
jgi:NAD(P)-dependent dehydrogenase (short-subunit alcohol dehydrogenase family)